MERPLDLTVTAHTSASPDQVLAAVCDFSERRPRLWPNVQARFFQVHDQGPDYADVTEGIRMLGVFWERERYDWSEPGAVRAVVTDSNVVAPGCRFEVRAVPTEDGCDIEMDIYRTFRRDWRGRTGRILNHLLGRRGWGHYLRRVLRNIERETAASAVTEAYAEL